MFCFLFSTDERHLLGPPRLFFFFSDNSDIGQKTGKLLLSRKSQTEPCRIADPVFYSQRNFTASISVFIPASSELSPSATGVSTETDRLKKQQRTETGPIERRFTQRSKNTDAVPVGIVLPFSQTLPHIFHPYSDTEQRCGPCSLSSGLGRGACGGRPRPLF